jgi:hypothetical protein
MPWIPLSDRLPQLPLVLAGPILRHTAPQTVTVWVALQAPCTVTLKVYSTEDGIGARLQQQILAGTRSTVAVGDRLHIVAVTATPVSETLLQSEHIYAYDLVFEQLNQSVAIATPNAAQTTQTLPQAINSPFSEPVVISYFNHRLPTFALPPKDLSQLRIAHGSCRKPLGEGLDALPIIDELLEQAAENPVTRIHQLFLTGDQIYGDDVADPFLFAATDAATALLGWDEPLPIAHAPISGTTCYSPKQLKPGQRSNFAEEIGGFTAGLRDQPERAKSHLFGFGEYCATYLLFWSQTLWAEQFPQGQEICQTKKQAKTWNEEVKQLYEFVHTLGKVRRLFANVPTYMIFDDHDISDDWYLNQSWCLRVLGKPLGRRTVQNGLLAYAVFQAWGNTPEQFQDEQVGTQLFKALEKWSASLGQDDVASEAIARYLGLPPQDPTTGLPQMRLDGSVLILDRDPNALTWHYTIRCDRHEVIVLDTRTWRGYPADQLPTAPPMLLSPSAFEQQIRVALQQTDQLRQAGKSNIEATMVVAPTNLVSLQLIDQIQHWNLHQRKVFDNDVGDAWNIHKGALAQLLSTLFEQRDVIIVLSGDIHYGSAVRLDYHLYTAHPSDPLTHASPQVVEQPKVLAQLTASAFCNAEFKTKLVHTKIKSLLPERDRQWLGWTNPLEVIEVTSRRSLQESDRTDAPDWGYCIHWIQRQRAQTPDWANYLYWLKSYHQIFTGWFHTAWQKISWLWRNRWLQEGKEVVGVNNVGIVHFDDETLSSQDAIVQDLYWYPLWNPTSIVYSRYRVPLTPLPQRDRE